VYVGHFAAGLALKTAEPKAPTWGLLLGVGLLDVLFALFFLRRGRRVAAFLGLAVFSHFLLDLPMHPGDLALWPHAATHLGFGLWTSLPRGWWFVELGVIAAAWGWYAWKARTASTFGGRPIAVGLVLLVLHIANAPWLQ
jgi:hypothetical protein